MRLFVAVDFEPAVRKAILEFTAEVRRELEARAPEAARAIKWVGPDQLHLTLHFLGEVGDTAAGALRARLAVPADEPPFDVEFGQIGWFPQQGSARVVWLDVARGRDGFAALHAEVGRRLKELGFTLEARRFAPHLTLGRIKRPISASALSPLRSKTGASIDACRIDHATLYESVLRPEGPVYTALTRTRLTSP